MKIDRPASPSSRGLLMFFACLLAAQLALPTRPVFAADFDPNDHAGKVVMLDFWASWCVPCRRSFPWLNTMHGKYADDGLVIVGVNLDLERAEADRFLAEFPASFKIVFDEKKALAKQFEVIAMPSTYVIGRNGKIVEQHLGFKVKQQAEYEAAIVSALAQNGTDDE